MGGTSRQPVPRPLIAEPARLSHLMILKCIRLTALPGCRQELLDRQRIWNDAMSRRSGFLGVQLAIDPENPDELLVLITIESRRALDEFMAGEHYELEQRTKIREAYENCEVRLLELV